MGRAESGLANFQRPLLQRLGLGVVPPILRQQPESGEAGGHRQLVWSIGFLMNRQRAFEQRTGGLVLTYIPVESSKVLQTQRDRLVLSSESSLGDCECPLKQGTGSRV